MAFQIGSSAVINNSRKGSFTSLNAGSSRPSRPSTGDFYYNASIKNIQVWNGTKWV